jgi:hypothetical protein
MRETGIYVKKYVAVKEHTEETVRELNLKLTA